MIGYVKFLEIVSCSIVTGGDFNVNIPTLNHTDSLKIRKRAQFLDMISCQGLRVTIITAPSFNFKKSCHDSSFFVLKNKVSTVSETAET